MALAVVLASVGIVLGASAKVSTASGSTAAPILGLLGATPGNYASEAAAGVGAVTIQVGWNDAELSQGVFSTAYLSQVQSEIAAAQAAHLDVVLDPGLQYPPAWVLAMPNSQFVDQYGDVFDGTEPSGNKVVNAVTNTAVRVAEGAYLQWLGTQFTAGQLIAVRQGGGPLGELRYPGPSYNGHANAFWAYDASSQAALPASVQGWTPGTGTTTQAQAFLTAYNQNLDNYGIWLNGQLHEDFNTRELLLLPGWGQRPGGAATEVAALLDPSQPVAEFNEGLDWADLLDSLPDAAHSVAYTTYLDAQTVLPTPQLEDPADYLASLVAGGPILLGGENSGDASLATMTFCMQQALRLNFYIVNWMGEAQLTATADGTDPSGPTLDQLGAAFSSVPAPVSAASPAFPRTIIGQSSTLTVTITATAPVTVASLAASGSFSLGTPSAPLPTYLPVNGAVSVPVTFEPLAVGSSAGLLTVTTFGDRVDQVTLTGTGENNGPSLASTASSITLASGPPGSTSSGTVGFLNDGSAPVTISSVTPPGTPFSSSGAPTAGQVIQPGAAVMATVTFSPTAVGQFSGSLMVDSNGGDIPVNLLATGTAPSVLEISSLSVSFGAVQLDQSATQSFQLSNVGGSTLTITESEPPAPGPFSASTSLPVGTTIPAGGSLTESVTFTPTQLGPTSDQWAIGANDGQGVQSVSLAGSGMVGGPSVGGWQLNGNAALSGGAVSLTSAGTTYQSGSIVSPVSVPTNGLTVSFDAVIGGGKGANGMTLTFASPTSPTFLGQAGGSLGYSGISGVAVGLVNFKQGTEPSANFAGIADGGPVNGIPNWLATTTAIPTLQGATTQVTVSINGTQLTVWLNGNQVLEKQVGDLPPQADLVFTAATGAVTDSYAVENVSIYHSELSPLSGWTLRGNAVSSGAGVALTSASPTFQSGSALAPIAVPTQNLSIAFDAVIGGGTGANGMTLTFASPTSPTFLGQAGGSLGYSGISGVAVGLVNFKQGTEPSANFAGIADGGPVNGVPNWVATTSTIPTLQGATTHVVITTSGTQITVSLDGTQVLQQQVADLPPSAFLMFTAATGGVTDAFGVQNLVTSS